MTSDLFYLKYEFREGRRLICRTVVALKGVDAVSELILQKRYVLYREIEVYLAISTIHIHSTLY